MVSVPARPPKVGARIVLVAGTLAVLLAGCGGGGAPTAPAASPTTTATTTAPTTTMPTTVPTTAPTTTTPTTTAPTTTVPTTTVLAPSSTTGQGDIGYDTSAAATYAVGSQPVNWDIHSMGASPWYVTLEQVLAQVWPSAFYVSSNGTPTLNTSLLSSVSEVSSDPETVVYQINPLAVWSNGVPITYRDFVYNWEAQSGRATFRDAGGTRFTPLDPAGYDDIANVTGTAANPRTVKVTFSSPYPDWQSLFAYLMPAAVAGAVGFDSGFKDPVADLVSGGPYLVSELQAGYSLELVRNARFWGSPADLSAVTYYFTSGAAETVNALGAGEIDLATVQATPTQYKQLQGDAGLSVRAVAGNFYEDLDMNEAKANGPLASPRLRRAIMMALDRGSMATQLLSPYGIAATPMEDRAFLPGNPGYADNGASYDDPAPAAALHLLTANGYALSAGILRRPDGQPVVLSLTVEAADPVAQELAQQVASACAAIGVTVNIVQTGPSASDVLGAAAAPALTAGWELAIELRQVPAFPTEVVSRYTPGGGSNQDGYSSLAMDALLAEVPTATAAKQLALFQQVDERAWKDYVDVPLVQVPMVVAVNSKLLNVNVGPFLGDIAWNEENWGFPAS
jgi:peptide/nickel transport system substrate-binding protein